MRPAQFPSSSSVKLSLSSGAQFAKFPNLQSEDMGLSFPSPTGNRYPSLETAKPQARPAQSIVDMAAAHAESSDPKFRDMQKNLGIFVEDGLM